MESEQELKRSEEARLLEWFLSEDWVIANSHTHTAVDIDEIQRPFVTHFPDAPDREIVPVECPKCGVGALMYADELLPSDPVDMERLIEKFPPGPDGLEILYSDMEIRRTISEFVAKSRGTE